MSLSDEIGSLPGRYQELEKLEDALQHEGNPHILIMGPDGIGKNALLDALVSLLNDWGLKRGFYHVILPSMSFGSGIKYVIKTWLDSDPSNFYFDQNFVESYFKKKYPKHYGQFKRTGVMKYNFISRELGHEAGILGAVNMLNYSLYGVWYNLIEDSKVSDDVEKIPTKKPILFIRDLPKITESNVVHFETLGQNAQIIARLDSQFLKRRHIKLMVSKFQIVVELEPLKPETCREIVGLWLKQNPFQFESESAKEHFMGHIERDSQGNPATLEQLLLQAKMEPVISHDSVRANEWQHTELGSLFGFEVLLIGVSGLVLRLIGMVRDIDSFRVWGTILLAIGIVGMFLKRYLDKE